MKKLIALLLCGLLSMSLLTGCGDNGSKEPDGTQGKENQQENQQEERGPEDQESEMSEYGETIPFTYTSYYSVYQMNSGVDYVEDPLYQYILNKFNIEPEMWACEDSDAKEKMQTWVNTETMPDCMWNHLFSLSSYYEYVDQGLLQALPEGWESRWPNIEYAIKASGMADVLKVDGKTYAIPHPIFGLYTEPVEGAMVDNTILFRKDLAEQVGMADFGSDYTVTVSELKEFLEKVKESNTVPIMLEGGDFFMARGFCDAFGLPESGTTIIETEEGFKFTPDAEKATYEKMLTELQGWYQNGLIDTDYFTKSSQDSINSFAAGQAAALYYASSPADIARIRSMYEGATGEDGTNVLGAAVMTADDGSLAITMMYNYWSATMFSPATDEKTLERILDLTDWLCSEEGNTSLFCGIPGVDWGYDEEGAPYLSETNAGDRNIEFSPFMNLGWCMDEFAFSGLIGDVEESDIEACKEALSIRRNASELYKVSDHYSTHKSELKSNYSFPLDEKIKEIICGNVDVENTWNEYVDENRNIWEPLINELNEAYGY